MRPFECSVLIIDNEEADRYVLKRLLKSTNIRGDIFEAHDGQQALDFLMPYEQGRNLHGAAFPPDLIFLDINMPVMNGFEFLNAFTTLSGSRHEYNSVVFVMITSSALEEEYEKAAAYSCVNDFLAKDTLSVEHLNEVLNKHVFLPSNE